MTMTKNTLIRLCQYLLLCFTFGLSISAYSQENSQTSQEQKTDWQVKPKACISENLGDKCLLTLEVELPELEYGTYCYFADERQLDCFEHEDVLTEVSIEFNENTMLSLRQVSSNSLMPMQDISDTTVFIQALEIRTRQTKKRVRRLRDPWSLF